MFVSLIKIDVLSKCKQTLLNVQNVSKYWSGFANASGIFSTYYLESKKE